MFNTTTTTLTSTIEMINNSPASGIIKKSHPKSYIKIVKDNSYILTKGYYQTDGYGKLTDYNKVTILQVIPYTSEQLLVEFLFNREIKEDKELLDKENICK